MFAFLPQDMIIFGISTERSYSYIVQISRVIMVFFLYLYDSHGKCPKISYTKVPDKMAYANSADPD